MNLSRLIGKLDAIATSGFQDAVKRRVAVDGLALTAESFRTSTDPYGVSWPGLLKPRPGGPVEDKTGAMKNSALAGPTTGGVRWYFAASYSGYQHHGTKYVAQRRLLPIAGYGLPAKWKAMIDAAFSSQMRQAVSV